MNARRPGAWRVLFAGGLVRTLALFVLAALPGLLPAPVHAQSCTADVQCPNGGRGFAVCVGDTLIVKRSICAGTCTLREERRETCAPRVLGTLTCVGNTAIRTTGGCDSSLQRCSATQMRDVCSSGCTCNGRRLVVASGTCVPGAGCVRRVEQCAHGCRCRPEPACF